MRTLIPLITLALLGCHEVADPPDTAPSPEGQPEEAPPSLERAAPVVFDAGLVMTCAIWSGQVECFGSEQEDAEWGVVSDAPQEGGWVALDADWWVTCALHEDGHVECWGRREITNGLVLEVEEQRGLVDFALGAAGGIGLRSDGSLSAWGSDAWGQVEQTPHDGVFIDVEAGYGWAAALDEHGQLYVWGIEDGEGVDWVAHNQVTDAPWGETFKRLRRSNSDTLCGVRLNDTLLCWGDQLGLNGAVVEDVSPADSYIAALTDSGEVETSGALLQDYQVDLDRSDVVNVPEGSWDAVTCGHDHCCVTAGPGDYTCWGSNLIGALDMYGLE